MTKNSSKFDVLIIYSGAIAHSAASRRYHQNTPFSLRGRHKNYNDSYRYFLQSCRKIGLNAAFSTSKDISGPGRCQSYWTYNQKWIRHQNIGTSKLIYDKFTPKTTADNKQYKLLTSNSSIHTFNNRKLTQIFQNKLRTYQQFKEFTVPTVAFNEPSRKILLQAKSKLDKLILKSNIKLNSEKDYLVKDKRGAGGFKIYKLNFNKPGISSVVKQFKIDRQHQKSLSYVLQPFIDCRNSYVIHKHTGLIDLRVILMDNKIIQTYIRVALPGNYKCNEHQGGNLIYLPLKTIPKDVRQMTKKIITSLSTKINAQQSLYALDFIRNKEHGRLYFIEGNSNPGLDWDHTKKNNALKSKDLINLITKKLKSIQKSCNKNVKIQTF